MNALVHTYAQPPREMLTPDTAETNTTIILGIIYAAFFIGSLYLWRRTGSPLSVLVMIGGLICTLN